jgi:hypothetical protein
LVRKVYHYIWIHGQQNIIIKKDVCLQKTFTAGRKFSALEYFGFKPPLKSSAGKVKSGLTDYKVLVAI